MNRLRRPRVLLSSGLAVAAVLGAVALPGPAVAVVRGDGGSPITRAALAPQAVAVKVPKTLFGVHPAYSTPAVPAGSWRLWDTGTDWCALQPDSSSQWRTAELDAQLQRARQAGVRDLLVVLGCTPSWAQRAAVTPADRLAASQDIKGFNTSAPPRDPATYTTYVNRLARYVKGRVARGTTVWFQAWNEASLSTFWRGTPAEMAGLTASARGAVRAASPAFRLVAASTTLRQSRSYAKFWRPYLKALRARGWPVDAFSLHSYPASTGTPAGRRALVKTALADMRREGAPARPVWDTELNFGLAGPGARYPFSPKGPATSAAWMSRAYLDSLRLGLARLYWYAWAPPGRLLGITLYDRSAGQAAFRTTAAWLSGAVYRGCTQSGPMVTCRVTRGSRAQVIRWSEGRSLGVRVAAGQTRVCPADGRACRVVKVGSRVVVGALPLRFSS